MKITLAPNETKPVTIAGGQFYLLSAFSKIAVKIISGGDSREFELSQGMGFKAREGERFFGVEIKDLGGLGQTIEFEISDREVFDNRSVGIVSVVNADKRRTEDGSSFLLARQFGRGTGLFACTAMVNPVGSGRNIFINQLLCSADKVGEYIYFVSKDYATHIVNPMVSGVAVGGAPVSKKVCANVGGSVIENYGFYLNSSTTIAGLDRVVRLYLKENDTFMMKLTEPIQLCEGSAIFFVSRIAESAVTSTYEYFEEIK